MKQSKRRRAARLPVTDGRFYTSKKRDLTVQRIPEPELMDDVEQATAYAEADFDESNTLFLDLFDRHHPGWDARGTILDLGCGPGDIAIRLARVFPSCEIHGLDGSQAMLDLAEAAKQSAADVGNRVQFLNGPIPSVELPKTSYEAVVSNSLLHHLHDPSLMWTTLKKYAAPGAPVLIMDLVRSASPEQAQQLVEAYASDDPE
ncbi:MAG: class I SAM-dependent methyltransferase, partial [Gammaproteobacteria bacterium]